MDQPENNPAYWRLRAEETRALAANLQDPMARSHMESAADSYERIAEMAERAPLIPQRPKAANQP